MQRKVKMKTCNIFEMGKLLIEYNKPGMPARPMTWFGMGVGMLRL